MIQNVILDIHGVLIGRPAFDDSSPGAFVAALRARGRSVHVVTNTSSQTPGEIAAALRCKGIQVENEEIINAAVVVATRLRQLEVTRVALIGSPVLAHQLEILVPGLELVEPGAAEAIVVTRAHRDDEWWSRLKVPDSCVVLATCRDRDFLDHSGPHTGPAATVARAERVIGRSAEVVGKPNPFVVRRVLDLPASAMPETVVIGDSDESDGELARRCGCPAVLVRAPGGPVVAPDGTALVDRLDEVVAAIEAIA